MVLKKDLYLLVSKLSEAYFDRLTKLKIQFSGPNNFIQPCTLIKSYSIYIYIMDIYIFIYIL